MNKTIKAIVEAGEIEVRQTPTFYEKHQNIIDTLAFLLLCIAGYFLAVIVALI